MLDEVALVAGKDLRIEWRSKVAIGQLVPFSLLVLVLFAFALDPERGVLSRVASGLYWVAVLFSTTLAVQRAFSIEAADGARDALRLSVLRPASVFVGKAAAIAAQLLALELVLGFGIVVLYSLDVAGLPLLAATAVAATLCLASAGTLYGALAAGVRARETLLPLLFLPVVAPVLIGATEAFEAALGGVESEGWPWCGFLVLLGLVYTLLGAQLFGSILEES
jgi:heme exporter protein B